MVRLSYRPVFHIKSPSRLSWLVLRAKHPRQRRSPSREYQHVVVALSLRAADTRTQQRYGIVFEHVASGGVDIRFIAIMVRHNNAQLVRFLQLGAAAEELSAYTWLQIDCLAPAHYLDVGPVRLTKHGQEYLVVAEFAGTIIGHADGRACVVDGPPLSSFGGLGLAHR